MSIANNVDGGGVVGQGSSNANAQRTERALVQVTLDGCSPRNLVVKGPKALLTVQNLSGLRAPKFRIDRGNAISASIANTVHEKEQGKETRTWEQEVDLTPGFYTLSIVGHTRWVCSIQVIGGGQ